MYVGMAKGKYRRKSTRDLNLKLYNETNQAGNSPNMMDIKTVIISK
jgi:hypothetical protein